MYPAVLFPNATTLVLSALGDLAATHSRIPTGRTLEDTFLLVRRLGGSQHDVVVDDATLAVEAWAPTDIAAHDLIQEARAVVHSLVGTQLDGVAVYRVQEFAGPASLPDPDSDHPRYTLTISVSLRGSDLPGS